MKKVLIISYFFPPVNLAGSYRVASWAKHLHKFGYYPVIVTRCWNENQTETTDELVCNQFSHEKYDTYEVYRLPYHRNFRDKLHFKYGENKFKFLRKFLTLGELFFQHYTNRVIPYRNLYEFAKGLISKNEDLTCLIVSGRPFQLFKFANQLHRETGIKWIADYRDEWNTHQWLLDESLSSKIIRALESRSERKWLKSASFFTTCSEHWVENIASYIKIPGKVVLNGYEDTLKEIPLSTEKPDVFTIVHNGTLFSSQPIEIFLNGFKKFVSDTPGTKIKLLFPGVENDPIEGDRICQAMVGYENYFKTSKRIPKTELIKMMSSAQMLLLIGVQGAKGHYSSKIFEYLAMHKPVILCPDDKDVMHELLTETKSGLILQNENEVEIFLRKAYSDFIAGMQITFEPDQKKISFYSREKQAEVLSKVIDQVVLTK